MLRQRRLTTLVVFISRSSDSILINNFDSSASYGRCGVLAACETVDLKDRVQFPAAALRLLTGSKTFNFRCPAAALCALMRGGKENGKQ